MDALQALYISLQTTLQYHSDVWDGRVYADRALTGASRPYVIILMQSGGEINAIQREDAEFTLIIKCVADTQSDAMQGASDLAELLNDGGQQDLEVGKLSAPPQSGWMVQTVTQTRRIQMVEEWENVSPIYHSGHQYEIRMERTS